MKYEHTMKISKTLSLVTLLAASACASNPNKEVESAESQVNKSSMDGNAAQNGTTVTNTGVQADSLKERRDNRTETTADAQKDSLAARAQLAEAKIKMAKEREADSIESQERMKKAISQADAAQMKSSKLSGKRAGEFKAAWTRYETAKTEAERRGKLVSAAADDSWAMERDSLKKGLDSLEKAASDVAAIP
jgi:hypothetical protein